MPDAWEKVHGLNPTVADNNGDFDGDGYTNLEEYLNDVAAFPAPTSLVFKAAGGNYEQFANWNSAGNVTDLRWQPSRYDEAQINAGVCTLNSGGQHANVLKIAATTGSTAEFDITAGWLKAESAVVIGAIATSTGMLHLAGGELSTPLLAKTGATSVFLFTGGKLHADTVSFDLLNQGGTIAPGDPIGGFDATGTYFAGTGIGQTHVQGNLTIQSGGVELELTSSTTFDKLTIDGALTAGGTLSVLLSGGFTPSAGQSFDLLDWGSESGAFNTVQLPSLRGVLSWDTTHLYDTGTISVVAVPEPSAIIILAMSLPALAIDRRRRNQKSSRSFTRAITRSLFAIVIIVSPLAANASTYYVSPAGNDSNNGTIIGSPFLTISKAVGLANPGDTIYLRGGTYGSTNGLSSKLTISTSHNGTAASPINLFAYPGDATPILDFHSETFSGANGRRGWHRSASQLLAPQGTHRAVRRRQRCFGLRLQ